MGVIVSVTVDVEFNIASNFIETLRPCFWFLVSLQRLMWGLHNAAMSRPSTAGSRGFVGGAALCASPCRCRFGTTYPTRSSCSSLAIYEKASDLGTLSGDAAARHAGAAALLGACHHGCLHVPQACFLVR